MSAEPILAWFLPLAFQGSPPPGGGMNQLFLMLIIFAIFYFLLIAPMRRRQKALQQLVDNIQRGDKVVTTGGIHGEVGAIDDSIVILKVADNVKLKVSKSAIAGVEGDGQQESKS